MSTALKRRLTKILKLVHAKNPDLIERRNSKHKALDLLVLLVLNQSTTDELSDRAFVTLKASYAGGYAEMLAEDDVRSLTDKIKICGLAPTKAGYILNLLRALDRDYDLEIEMTFLDKLSNQEALDYLTSIRGIGIKSASCMLMFAKGRDTFPIDTHLFRVMGRLGQIFPATQISSDRAHRLLQPLVCGDLAYYGHLGLIELGRSVCRARKPVCAECYLVSHCDFAKSLD